MADLTVYTIAGETAADAVDVVDELGSQTIADRIELLIVSPDRESFDEALLEPFAEHGWLLLPELRNCGEAMAAAVRAASGTFVVYAEEHATFDDRWAERLLAAHARGYDAVGFVMHNANPATLTSWAHYFAQFGELAPPAESGERDFLAGHHVSYRRSFLLDYGEDLEAAMEDESALFLHARERGVPLYLAADAVSTHLQVSDLRSLIALDHAGARSFATTRARLGRWPAWKRLLYVAATPLIPLVRLRDTLYHVRRTGRSDLLPGLLGPLLPMLAAGAVGEMLGYLLGPGRSAERKAPAELHRADFLAPVDRRPAAG